MVTLKILRRMSFSSIVGGAIAFYLPVKRRSAYARAFMITDWPGFTSTRTLSTPARFESFLPRCRARTPERDRMLAHQRPPKFLLSRPRLVLIWTRNTD